MRGWSKINFAHSDTALLDPHNHTCSFLLQVGEIILSTPPLPRRAPRPSNQPGIDINRRPPKRRIQTKIVKIQTTPVAYSQQLPPPGSPVLLDCPPGTTFSNQKEGNERRCKGTRNNHNGRGATAERSTHCARPVRVPAPPSRRQPPSPPPSSAPPRSLAAQGRGGKVKLKGRRRHYARRKSVDTHKASYRGIEKNNSSVLTTNKKLLKKKKKKGLPCGDSADGPPRGPGIRRCRWECPRQSRRRCQASRRCRPCSPGP